MNKSDPTRLATDFMWDFARYGDSANTSQGTFAQFTHGAYMGDTGGGGGGRLDGSRPYMMAGQGRSDNQGGVRHGDGYGASAVEAGLQREGDAKKIGSGNTEGVTEIGQDMTNPRQFYSPPAHGGNKEVSNFKDDVKKTTLQSRPAGLILLVCQKTTS